MIKVGITGQSGFIGTHLYNTLGLYPKKFERIPFKDEFFQDEAILKRFVSDCDAIVHLAALNRHNDPNVIYQTNVQLVQQLISACESTNSIPHILFSSSIQEEQENQYGKSKRDGRELLKQWAIRNQAVFSGIVLSNVFGPFGNPYHNSFIATFCHQLTHGEQPRVDVDGKVKLIYVSELVEKILEIISKYNSESQNSEIIKDAKATLNPSNECSVNTISIPHTSEVKVSYVLSLLKDFTTQYFLKGNIPNLTDTFVKNLYNTYLCYIEHKSFFPFQLKLNSDWRGNFAETIKLSSGGQISFSSTIPGITRGNHFHTRKAERFAVIKGEARIDLRKIGTDDIISFNLDGRSPSFVDMPVWYTHNITNIGDEDVYTIFWINEHYNTNDADTYFETV
jgi:UDP-2-acetamido-2,6-beta-L-arabino-hexul-4-ose reductase